MNPRTLRTNRPAAPVSLSTGGMRRPAGGLLAGPPAGPASQACWRGGWYRDT